MFLQSEGFIFVILSLVNHISSSAPADKNQILNLKYLVTLIELLRDSQSFLLKRHKPGPQQLHGS